MSRMCCTVANTHKIIHTGHCFGLDIGVSGRWGGGGGVSFQESYRDRCRSEALSAMTPDGQWEPTPHTLALISPKPLNPINPKPRKAKAINLEAPKAEKTRDQKGPAILGRTRWWPGAGMFSFRFTFFSGV